MFITEKNERLGCADNIDKSILVNSYLEDG